MTQHTPEMTDRTRLEAAISQEITDIYSRYKRGLLRHEPSLTVTYLTDVMEMTGSVRDFFPIYRKTARRMVQAACDRMVRAGQLTTSIGCGEHGRDARCYEPKG